MTNPIDWNETMKTKTDAELDALIREAANERGRRKREQFEKKAKDAVGKYYRYRNNYGIHGGDWWLYAKIVGVATEGLDYLAFTFQKCSDDRIEICKNDHFRLYEGWNEIDENTFLDEYRKIIGQASKIPRSVKDFELAKKEVEK